MDTIDSFSQHEVAPRENNLFSKMGWWIGTSQVLGGIGIFLLILGFNYLRDKLGFDIIKMLGPNAGSILVFSGIATLLSGFVLIPPTLKLIRARVPIMNNMYAAPALALIFALAATFALKSPSMVVHGQDGKEIQAADLSALAASVSQSQASANETQKTDTQAPAIAIEETPKSQKTGLRGTIYTAR